jgi:hypothetical protein
MLRTYLLIDVHNLFFRVRHGVRAPDTDQQLALGLHIIFHSIRKVWNQFDGNHAVFCLEGRSWRKDVYPQYKANRKVAAAARTSQEVEDDRVFFEVMDEFIRFIGTQTNCTVLRHPEAEADDMIARWIAVHPDDQHVIISSDGDFQQLLAKNVSIYNGIAGLLHTINGVYDKDGKIAKDRRGNDMAVPDPEWLLFEKCMRGDAGDNVMSAYPGVRTKRIQEAFEDRHRKQFAWNNLMLSKWQDHEGVQHDVKRDFERNQLLIDLNRQPSELIEKFDTCISQSVITQPRRQVGTALMRFCNTHGLIEIEKSANQFSPCFSSVYDGPMVPKVG